MAQGRVLTVMVQYRGHLIPIVPAAAFWALHANARPRPPLVGPVQSGRDAPTI
jgi:hypothetical protein